MEQGQSARGGKAILLGRPQGVVTSHGTISAYQRRRCAYQGAATGHAFVSAKTVSEGFKQDVTTNAIAKSRNV